MTTPPDSHFDKIRKAAIELKIADAAKGANILIKRGAMPDLVGRAFADLTVDRDGFLITRAGGKHMPAVQFLHHTRKAAPWFFEDGAGVTSAGPDKTLPGGPKVVPAGEAGQHLADIAAGKVTVQFKSDGTA